VNAPLQLLSDTPSTQQEEWEATGYTAIARGQVATILLATSTVPGYSAAPRARALEAAPGLPSGKCALQLYAERLVRLQQLAAAAVYGRNAPVTRRVGLYIMTAPDTHSQVGAPVVLFGGVQGRGAPPVLLRLQISLPHGPPGQPPPTGVLDPQATHKATRNKTQP